MSVQEQRAFRFVVRSVAPAFMVLLGFYQIRHVLAASRAACDQLPLTRMERARAFVTFLLIVLPAPVTILQGIHDSFIWENVVQHALEFLAWTCVFYLQTLEIHRFVVSHVLYKVFALTEALFLIEQVYRLIVDEESIGLCAIILFQYACTVLMAGFAFMRFRGVDKKTMWWALTQHYGTDGYADTVTRTGVTSSLDSRLSEEVSVEIESARQQLQKALLNPVNSNFSQHPMPTSKGPLSVFVRHFDVVGLDDASSISDIWGMSSYCIFTVRVKWEKSIIWEVKRRFSDFNLLRNSLRKGRPSEIALKKSKSSKGKINVEGLTRNTFEPITEVFPPKHNCLHKDQDAALTNMVQGLNQFLQELLSSSDTKYHELFRAFCAEGRVACVNEKFSDQLCIYDFQLLSVVGKGSYGKVMQARKKDSGKIYAIKVLLKRDLKKQTQITHTQTERHILGAVTHPFICSLRYAFQNRTKLYMVMDFFNGGELFFHLNKGPFDEVRTRYYIAEITLAIEHLHSLLVVYRDLKPENVLLDSDGHIKLSDFGLSKKFKKDEKHETRTFCGTPQYVAPEIIHNKGYGFGVDWWAMGCLTYELLTRKPPFEAKNSNALYNAICHSPVTYPGLVSPVAKSFIAGLLEKNPAQRLGFKGADEIKGHPFFEGMDWNALLAKKIPVPFKPPQDPEDTSCVWKDFLDDEVKDTPTEAPLMDSLVRDLPGFTFAPQTLNTFAGSMAVSNLLGDGRSD